MYFERLSAFSGEIFYLTDLQGKILKLKGGVEKITGFSPKELIGTNINELYQFTHVRTNAKALLFSSGIVENIPLTIIDKTGRELNVTERIHLSKNEKGELIGFEGIISLLNCP